VSTKVEALKIRHRGRKGTTSKGVCDISIVSKCDFHLEVFTHCKNDLAEQFEFTVQLHDDFMEIAVIRSKWVCSSLQSCVAIRQLQASGCVCRHSTYLQPQRSSEGALPTWEWQLCLDLGHCQQCKYKCILLTLTCLCLWSMMSQTALTRPSNGQSRTMTRDRHIRGK
jgi:hypothetical protein